SAARPPAAHSVLLGARAASSGQRTHLHFSRRQHSVAPTPAAVGLERLERNPAPSWSMSGLHYPACPVGVRPLARTPVAASPAGWNHPRSAHSRSATGHFLGTAATGRPGAETLAGSRQLPRWSRWALSIHAMKFRQPAASRIQPG